MPSGGSPAGAGIDRPVTPEWFPRRRGDRPIVTGPRVGPWGSPAGAGIDLYWPSEGFPRRRGDRPPRFPRRRGDRPLQADQVGQTRDGSPAGAGIDPRNRSIKNMALAGSPAGAGIDPARASWSGYRWFPRRRGDRPCRHMSPKQGAGGGFPRRRGDRPSDGCG